MMKMRRVTLMVIAAFVLAAVTAPFFVMAHESDHDCTGDNCPVCALISICENTLEALGGAMIPAAAVLVCLSSAVYAVSSSRVTEFIETPVSLKVKLLN